MLIYEITNGIHPLFYLASQANEDVLYCYQAIKAENPSSFSEVMNSEVESFKKQGTFELIPINNKSQDRIVIPFAWSFKRK